MKKTIARSAFLLLFSLSCATSRPEGPIHFKLAKSGHEPVPLQLPSCAAVSSIAFEDLPSTPHLTGYRSGFAGTPASNEIYVDGDLGKWLQENAADVFTRAHLGTDPSRCMMRIRLVRFDVQEEREKSEADYLALFVFDFELWKPGAAEPAFKQRLDGMTEIEGRPGVEKTYQRATSHAVQSAFVRLLTVGDFTKALCSGACAK